LLSVTANPAGLTAGKYNSTVTITAAGVSNSPFSVPVTLNVSNATTTISVSNSALSFTAITGSTTISSQNVNVTSATPTAVAVSTQGSAWLTATISGATTPAVVTVSVNPSNLTAGSYTGTVAVTAASATDSPQNISVKFVVSAPPSLTVTPASLSFAYTLGGAAPAAQSISVTATQQVGIATSITNGAWLTINNSSASTPANLTVSVNPAGLTAGTYNATITIAGIGTSNSPQTAAVTLVVSGPPTFSGSPSSLTFTAQSGAAGPAAQSISLTGGSTLQFAVATAPSWLSVSASANTTPATLVATVNSKGMAQGTYQGTITITNSAAGNSPYVIPVTLTLSAPQVAAGPLISSVVNAASYATTGFSPGAILSIFGSLLGPQTGVSFTVNSQGGLDTTLSGTTVTVGGLLAIPLFVQNGQVNVILPYTLATSGPATVTVEYNNLASAAFNIQLSPADVQIFTANASGSGPGSILNQDYSVNTVTNPAAPGSVVQVFGTGAGALNPSAPVIAGNVAVDNPLSWVSSQYSATVNGENAVVLYAGSAPGLVYGVDQFNVQLPADLPSGPQNIVLTVGASTSQTDVTVFVN
jgi:trimeric autotransporter adhesin